MPLEAFGHIRGASTIAHAEFERRILDWFQTHTEPLPK
jgi:hypothetical protein